MMGQRLAWYLQALDNLALLEYPPIPKIIDTNPPSCLGESLEEVQRSWTPKSQRKAQFQAGTGVVGL
jgi:hypothetical protein